MNMMQILMLAVGGMLVLGLVGFAFLGPDAGKQGARRLQAVRFRHSDSAADKMEAQLRKALASRKPAYTTAAAQISRWAALALRLHQTGKHWTVEQYLYTCAGITAVIGLLVYMRSGVPLLALAVGVAVGAGVPHMVVGHLIQRRANAFISKFPDAIELLVRGLRSGLPVTETLGIVSREVRGPVAQEFKLVTERIRIGRTMEEALQETADRLSMAEFNFFCITLAIQRETGGNLAETLANLADVLRKRAQMKLKIKAMSSESKASAYIVGSLPFLVFGMIYWINPEYLGGFFTDQRLIVVGLGAFVWMGTGAFIMAKMVSFEI
ncbi:MAG TPA: type II secretion system F family protein [Novosphingobium sp.]|nr:type II secretion system F family protein [Novosphingobium sp.]HZV11120.1 type II secretion system F family protein [Novosphingobium sp.]